MISPTGGSRSGDRGRVEVVFLLLLVVAVVVFIVASGGVLGVDHVGGRCLILFGLALLLSCL